MYKSSITFASLVPQNILPNVLHPPPSMHMDQISKSPIQPSSALAPNQGLFYFTVDYSFMQIVHKKVGHEAL